MTKKYRIILEAEEREHLRELLAKSQSTARKLKHAQILLAAEESPQGPGRNDDAIAQTLNVGRATVERVRRRFAEEGLERALTHYRPRGQREEQLKAIEAGCAVGADLAGAGRVDGRGGLFNSAPSNSMGSSAGL